MKTTDTQRAIKPLTKGGSITLSGLSDLETILDTARQCVRRVRLAGENGDMGPDEASEILSDALDSIKGWSNRDAIALLRNSLPVEHEPAPPVPESLEDQLVNPFHKIRYEMNLRGGSFVRQLSKLMAVADADNLYKITKAFPEIMERYDAMASAESTKDLVTKYFTDGTSIWKFAPGKSPQTRFKTDKSWDDSAFTSLSEFSASPGDTWEIDEEDAEP